MKDKKVTKTNESDRWAFGVIGGLSKKLGIDATIPRIAFLLTTIFCFGSLLIIYLILAFFMPDEETNPIN